MYTGWDLSILSVMTIKRSFKTVHPDFIGTHITYMFGKDSEVPDDADIFIVGQCVTDDIQCFVVEVDGSTKRPDGKIYHITWSIDKSKGAAPVKSNAALASVGYETIPEKIKIRAYPRAFK